MVEISITQLIIITVISYPISHLIMKKGMIMDLNITDERSKDLTKFFYIPLLNVIISFIYILWVIIKFKRPD